MLVVVCYWLPLDIQRHSRLAWEVVRHPHAASTIQASLAGLWRSSGQPRYKPASWSTPFHFNDPIDCKFAHLRQYPLRHMDTSRATRSICSIALWSTAGCQLATASWHPALGDHDVMESRAAGQGLGFNLGTCAPCLRKACASWPLRSQAPVLAICPCAPCQFCATRLSLLPPALVRHMQSSPWSWACPRAHCLGFYPSRAQRDGPNTRTGCHMQSK